MLLVAKITIYLVYKYYKLLLQLGSKPFKQVFDKTETPSGLFKKTKPSERSRLMQKNLKYEKVSQKFL